MIRIMTRTKTKCLICEKEISVITSRLKKGRGKYCSRKCYYKKEQIGFVKGHTLWKLVIRLKGKDNPAWRGGKRHSNGYVSIKVSNHPQKQAKGCVLEHRLVMEKYLGRYLDPKEIVHHINGIRGDNRIKNLLLFSSSGLHTIWHSVQRKKLRRREMLIKELS